MTATALVLSVALASALPGASPQGVNLAALDGWDIVVAADAIASEVYAAEEFRDLFRRAGGARLPIVQRITRPKRHVFIGPGQAMRRSPVGFGVKPFGPEDLRIVVRDENIAIAGGRPRGTLYGVYTFLEDYLGVRFLTADHTHVPSLGRWRKVGPVDRFYHPPMELRWAGYQANHARPDFTTRLRLNAARLQWIPPGSKEWGRVGKYGGRTPIRHIGHSFNRLLPPAKYAKDHPEYYCLYEGRRLATLKPGEKGIDFKRGQFPYGMQPCLTNPEVLRIITKKVLAEFAARPNVLNISVGQNDGSKHCQCPACAAIDEREGTKMGTLLTLVNAVADEVARKYPDRMISTLAYSRTAAPPKTLRPRDNVQIMWCSISTCFVHAFDDRRCRTNDAHIKRLRQWARITRSLYVWNYFLNDERHSCQLPLPNLRLIGPNIRYQMSLGVRGMYMQATGRSHGNEWEDLRNYLLCNLIWDPSRDGRKLMNEWLDLQYGPAAPPMRRWIDRLHDRATASGKHCRCLGGRFSDYGLDESDARAGLVAIEEAMRLAGDDKAVRNRVDKASLWAYRAAIEPVWYAKEGEEIDLDLVARMRPLVKRFFELCKKHGVTRTTLLSRDKIGKYEKRLRGILGSWDKP